MTIVEVFIRKKSEQVILGKTTECINVGIKFRLKNIIYGLNTFLKIPG